MKESNPQDSGVRDYACVVYFSREDARHDSEITIMRLGRVGRMCIQSRVGENRTAERVGQGGGKEWEGETERKEEFKHERGGISERAGRRNEGVIKYPTADVKSGRKMHQVPCS